MSHSRWRIAARLVVVVGLFCSWSTGRAASQPPLPPPVSELWFTGGGAVGEAADFNLRQRQFRRRPFTAVWSVNPPNNVGRLFPPYVPAATGTLDGAGNAPFSLGVPNLPALVGILIYVQGGVVTTTQFVALSNVVVWPIAGRTMMTTRRVGSLAANAVRPTTIALSDDRFFMCGGIDEVTRATASASVLLFDPTTSRLTTVGSMTTPRSGHQATQLSDGRVLIIGANGISTSSAEFYDPLRNWSIPVAGTLSGVPATAALVQDPMSQREWVFYGTSTRAMIYDAQSNNFTFASFSPQRFGGEALVPLVGRPEVAIVGGTYGNGPTDRVDVYNAATRTFRFAGRMTRSRSYPAAIALDQRYLLVVDGWAPQGDPRDVELFDLVTGRGTLLPVRLRVSRGQHAIGIGRNGRVVVCGGSNRLTLDAASILMEALSPTTATPLRPLPRLARYGVGYTFNRRGEILVTGERDLYLVR